MCLVRHPMAHGLLSLKAGIAWTMAWGILAVAGAFILNPICVVIFISGCVLEAIYCFLFSVSPFRILISGVVKTSGGLAAVFAVDPSPSPLFLFLLFFMLFCWEVGGQNIPHDWEALDQDRRLDAKTVPLLLGVDNVVKIVLLSLVLAFGASFGLVYTSQSRFGIVPAIAIIFVGVFLLLLPAVKLYRTRKRTDAMRLFNRASYYPLALLIVAVVNTLM